MIRNSALIATVALAFSLLAHLFGVSFIARVPEVLPREEAATGDVSLGSAFEDIAEAVSQPEEPEPAPSPEPAVEPVTEAPPLEMETSQALVAAADPQPSASPGTGPAPEAPADTITPAEPAPSSTPEPEGADQPVAADAQAPPSEVTPSSDTVEAIDAPTPRLSAATVSQAAPAAPQLEPARDLPVTPSSDPDAIPVIVGDLEPAEPVPSEAIVAITPEPETVEQAEDPSGVTELAVLASPRPQARTSRPSASAAARLGYNPPPILFPESPLVAYARDGNLSNWGSTLGSGSSGNATVTNYAGQVLVHLNRVPSRRFGSRATARVLFEINPDGSLAWVDVIDSTGTFEFDNAAKAQVRNAAPFPLPPAGAKRHFSFVYQSGR